MYKLVYIKYIHCHLVMGNRAIPTEKRESRKSQCRWQTKQDVLKPSK